MSTSPIDTWLKERAIEGTLANVARRILASDKTYQETEKNLRAMYVLEAVIKNGGNQKQAAISIGVCQHAVLRSLRSMGMTGRDVRKIAKFIQEKNANS